MLTNPFGIIVVLLCIEASVLYVSSRRGFEKYFKFIPPVFWIYFLPMLVSTAGFIDSQSPVYSTVSGIFLPASLFLLLLSSDIKSIMKLDRPALGMMLAGSVGIMVGVPFVFYFFRNWVGAGMWSGFGALSASWIGGSANMIAVKEAIGTPDSVFTPMVIVDTVVPYVWMGVLVAAAGFQKKFDCWNKSNRKILDELSCTVTRTSLHGKGSFRFSAMTLSIFLALGGSFAARCIAGYLPVVQDVISPYAWTIILVSALGIVFSFTPLRALDNQGASRIGYWMLYFVLTSIGAKANISNIGSTLVLIIAGCLIVLFHAGVLLTVARIIKAPMFLAAVASQANIGGVASAPVIAAIYQPGLASVGLLLAIVGNIIGTYLGIITAQVCRFLT
ncbi:MAG: DUF819 family protein [Candidatus Omnitrophica bacterium]|nr:DUF819 family protein [Candidatus Omnitrophota bacterium]